MNFYLRKCQFHWQWVRRMDLFESISFRISKSHFYIIKLYSIAGCIGIHDSARLCVPVNVWNPKMAWRSSIPLSMMLSINSFFSIGTRLLGLFFHPSTYSLKAFPRFHTRSSNCVYFSLLYRDEDKHGLHFSEEFNAKHSCTFFLWNGQRFSLELRFLC